jgi:Ni,Fe-hydrogenase III large subunit
VSEVKAHLALLRKDVGIINEHFLGARTVKHRLRGIGALSQAQARELGLVDMAARACGVAVDTRQSLPARPYVEWPIQTVVEESGDCWARVLLRIREIDASLDWLDAAVQRVGLLEPSRTPVGPLAPGTLAVGICEGWRGETVHCLETDSAGALHHYKVQDPSLRNWFGLALCLRDNDISDFPICNKSFDLSYCGNDL